MVGDGYQASLKNPPPQNPVEVGFLEMPDSAHGIYVSGSYAYVADWDSGLRVIDVGTPENPVEVGFYCAPVYSYSKGVYVEGGLIYLANSGGLYILRYTGGVEAINGHVTDLARNPIKLAMVIAIKRTAKAIAFTDKDGYYEIKDLQPGSWLVICMKKGYKARIAKVEVKANETTTRNFRLRPKLRADDEDEFTDLYANYPNPFNPDTWIPYSLSKDAEVTIRIYNSAGQLVRTLNLGRQTADIYMTKSKAAYWNGKDDLGQQVASGVYFYTLRAGDFSTTRKMVISK